MRIRDVLQSKGHDVVTVPTPVSVSDALSVMVEHEIGAVVVVDGEGAPVGILSERDILRLLSRNAEALGHTEVGEVMSAELIVGLESDDLEYVMEVMTRNRVRHLPIVEESAVTGIVSIGDVVNALRSHVEAENRYLRQYITG